jgi:hypothetical protein
MTTDEQDHEQGRQGSGTFHVPNLNPHATKIQWTADASQLLVKCRFFANYLRMNRSVMKAAME